jgi:RNA polymerase sigma-70 factor (ECF subfamily)
MPGMQDRDNAAWLQDLGTPGAAREAALADLRQLLMRSLPRGLTNWLPRDHPDFETLLEDSIQEGLLRVLDALETFEGRSQFTTWVYKIAVRVALNELRRRRWRDVSLDELQSPERQEVAPRQFASTDAGPEAVAERRDAMERVQRVMAEALTERQRTALMAVTMQGVALEEVARRMDTNRNALYKLLHDARVRLRKRLEQEGLPLEELLGMFVQE